MHSDEREWVVGSDAKIDLKRILVAYDFSDYSELALNYSLDSFKHSSPIQVTRSHLRSRLALLP
jgi:hypothetical protein